MTIRLLVLLGPTASGKTRLGVETAHALGSEILSADSRQVYRGLDIGSGKDLEEYAAVSPPVPCHLIDMSDPGDIYSVFHYQRDCYRLLEEKATLAPYVDGTPLVMVGGTGLFVEAVLKGYRIPDVPEDEGLRRELMTRGHEELVAELGALDKNLLERTDAGSKKRVVRALEVARFAEEHEIRYSPETSVAMESAVFVIDIPAPELHRRIDTRLASRMEQGLIEEVQGLLDRGLPVARMNQLGLEYREVTAYLTGTKSRDQMLDDLRTGIRQLAKRQRTWFRGLPRRGIDVRSIGSEDSQALLNHRWD